MLVVQNVAIAESSSSIDPLGIQLGKEFPFPALFEAEKRENSPPYIQFRAPIHGLLSQHFVDIQVNLFLKDRRVIKLYSVQACKSFASCEEKSKSIVQLVKSKYSDLALNKERNLYISKKENKEFVISSFIGEGSSNHELRFEVSNATLKKELGLVFRNYANR